MSVDDGEDEEAPLPPDVSLTQKVADLIRNQTHRVKWKDGDDLQLGSVSWRPHLTSTNSLQVLYVNITGDIPRWVQKRLRAARELGLEIYVALPLNALYSEEILDALTAVEAQVLIIESDDFDRVSRKARHFLAAMADIGVPTPPATRTRILNSIMERVDDGRKHEKGRRLEALVAYLLSQITDLRVVARNYVNRTQEIDIVLQIDRPSSRIWQRPGVPVVLVEVKNRKEKVDQQSFNAFIGKIKSKRGACEIGFIFSVGGFTQAARDEELKFARSKTCVAMFDRAAIDRLIAATDLDSELEQLVRDAMLA